MKKVFDKLNERLFCYIIDEYIQLLDSWTLLLLHFYNFLCYTNDWKNAIAPACVKQAEESRMENGARENEILEIVHTCPYDRRRRIRNSVKTVLHTRHIPDVWHAAISRRGRSLKNNSGFFCRYDFFKLISERDQREFTRYAISRSIRYRFLDFESANYIQLYACKHFVAIILINVRRQVAIASDTCIGISVEC